MRRSRLAGILLVREPAPPGSMYVERTPLRCARDVATALRPFFDAQLAEVFTVVAVDTQHRMIGGGPVIVSRGILNSSPTHPREVFRAAIAMGAAAIILAHNHPSGDPTPSADDRAVTEQMLAAGRLLAIPVHDHVILGAGDRYVSMAEAGLL